MTDHEVGELWNIVQANDWHIKRLIRKLVEERAMSLKNAHGWLAAGEPNHGQTQGRGQRANLCGKCNQRDSEWVAAALADFGIPPEDWK